MIIEGPELSIIVPVLNEALLIEPALEKLQFLRNRGVEIIVVDGGSEDGTDRLARPFADTVISVDKSEQSHRAKQMNLGAMHATGRVLLFLHVDTQLPQQAYQQILSAIELPRVWGRFDINLSGQHFMFRIIETLMNLRSSLTGVATGDQGIFVAKDAFIKVNGFADIPLMEDVEISKKLRKLSFPVCLKQRATTSSRRWEKKGVVKTILQMWWLRALYFIGAHPRVLAKQYYR